MVADWISLILSLLPHLVSGAVENVARGKPTEQSSIYYDYFRAGYAVDGNITTIYPDGLVHTEEGKSFAWWKVDLETQVHDAVVKIYFRTDYKVRRNGVQLYTSNSQFYTNTDGHLCYTIISRTNGTDVDDVVNVTCSGIWRFLMVYTETDNDGFGSILDFAEVEVLVAGINVALNKRATKSSSNYPKSSSSLAVDGNTTTMYPGTINTDVKQSSAWWVVDLRTPVQDPTVKLYFRTDRLNTTRRNGVQLYTSVTPFSSFPDGLLCKTISGDASGSDIDDVITCSCLGTWRFLLIYTETNNDRKGPVLDFGEVEVLVCRNRTYGAECNRSCSDRHCIDLVPCDRDGTCIGGCTEGWTGVDCWKECSDIFYGENCGKSCSARHCSVTSKSCDRFSGACPPGGCKPGWTGTDCTKRCPAGTFGVRCWPCDSRHCRGDSRCPDDGICPEGCQDGWTLQTYTQVCPNGSYGSNCTETCGRCDDENGCHPETGHCPSDCKVGFEKPFCKTTCNNGTYGINCKGHCGHCNGTCHVDDGHCPAGCMMGYFGYQCIQKLEDDQSNPIASTIIIVVVTVLVMSVIIGVLIFGLFSCRRLKWLKGSSSEVRQSTEMNEINEQISSPSSGPAEHAHSTSHVYSTNYSSLDEGTKAENKEYEVLNEKVYENV